MRRVLLTAAFLALAIATTARLPARTFQADPVPAFMAALEAALSSGDAARLKALESPDLSAADAAVATRALSVDASSNIAVRARTHKASGNSTDILTDVFVGHGPRARLVTWRLTAQPGADGNLVITALDEQSALDRLVKLSLDSTKQFAVHNLTFRATDLTLTMASGAAFVASVDEGVTALVLVGRAEVNFTPPDPAEQGQLRIFARKSELAVSITSAFIRLNPAEFATRIATGALTPEATTPDQLAEARQVFDQFAPQSYGVDLNSFGQRGWSFEPGEGNVVVEFKTGRYGWLTYARTPADLEDVSLFKRATSKVVSSYASKERLATRGRYYNEDANAAYSVEHYELDVAFDPARSIIRGRGAMLLRITAETVSALTLRLDDDLQVSAVTSPGSGKLLAVRISGQNRVLVSLPGSLHRGAEVVIDLTYAGRLPSPGLDREAMFVPQQGQTVPRVEEFRPDPEPLWIYSGRTAWYPQPEAGGGHATAVMRFRVPADYDIVASGTAVRSSVDGPPDGAHSQRVAEFVADRPVRYLACAISRFQPVTSVAADVPALSPSLADIAKGTAGPGPASININVVATPRAAGGAKALGARAADMLHFYATLLGEAPYGGLTIAAADDNMPGGHSPAFLTILHQRLSTSPFDWRADPVAFDPSPNFLLAHEVAHQWWGQAVGWKNYHEQWLSEGLAQYFAALYVGQTQGQQAMRDLLKSMRDSALSQTDNGPIALGYRLGHIANDSTTFRVILYNKTAVVLDMLRRLMGEKAFMTGLTRFYRDNRFRAAGTDDFIKAMQPETTIPLGPFFDTWVQGTVVPEVRVFSQVDRDGQTATVRVSPAAPGTPVADFPLTFSIQYADGQSEDVTIPVIGNQAEQQIPLKTTVRRMVTREDLTLVKVK